MSKIEAKEIMETISNIGDRDDKKRYAYSALVGLRSVDFFEFFTRDHMRVLGSLFKVKYATRIDKWDLCEEVDYAINDL